MECSLYIGQIISRHATELYKKCIRYDMEFIFQTCAFIHSLAVAVKTLQK